ncbi:MAG: class I SAM-dependent methyltransferase, partial [Patescibacteria group bacterium]
IKIGSMLDMGCGRGYLLDEAKKIGWKVHGVDYSKNVVKYAREVLALDVEEADIVKFKTNKKYDAVVINQVIEHFSDPKPFIVSARLALKSGGIVYIATPNIYSYLSRFKDKKFDYIIPPEHLSYYSKKSLEYLLTNLNFKFRYCGSWSYPQDLAGVIKSVFGKNNTTSHMSLKSNIISSDTVSLSKFKKFKSFLFDGVFCKLFYYLLNINVGGTNIEVIYQK